MSNSINNLTPEQCSALLDALAQVIISNEKYEPLFALCIKRFETILDCTACQVRIDLYGLTPKSFCVEHKDLVRQLVADMDGSELGIEATIEAGELIGLRIIK